MTENEKIFTQEDVNKVLGEIVAEYGKDFKYDRPGRDVEGDPTGPCYYVHKDAEGTCRPGCIIGHLLFRLGLINLNEVINTSSNSIRAGEFLARKGLTGRFTRGALRFMDEVQAVQDRVGATWGEALAYGRGTPTSWADQF